ncbi:MAG TPA: cob(I)yrinic acid a,c-diamide adenosyltransferase [Candidatus Paceibacterota bacterium]|nr:cob(I)yrinic acid a,c-diamide adenosyltransferase [Candidatus Paceibacterota bacterium]
MLYTGQGDDGKTSLFHCDQRLSKSSQVAEALGALDELNSLLGWCKVKAPDLAPRLEQVQNKLFVIQAEVAGADKFVAKSDVSELENWIGEIEKKLPPVKSFIIAGGSELSAMLDFARTIARRTERRVVAVKGFGDIDLKPETLAYLNRLSSLLYALARQANQNMGIKEDGPSYQ